VSELPRGSWKDRLLDRLPLFGRVRRAKGWLRRHRGWIYLGLFVAIVFVVRPVLTILAEIFKILQPMIRVLFDNPAGRLIFYNVLAIVLLWFIWRRVRAGVLRVFGLFAMRRFLDGMNAMILSRWQAAIVSFEKVMRVSRWVTLEDAVPEHRDMRADVHLKIAACYLRLHRPNEAKEWLLRVREADILTDHVRRSWVELKALSYDLNDELEEETILKELERSQVKDRSNRRVLIALRDRLGAHGDLARAREVSRRLVAVSQGRERDEAERELALLEVRSAHLAVGAGDDRGARKRLKPFAHDVRAALMLGDLALNENDVKGALQAWSRAVSLPVFDRLASLLESGRLAGDRERELLLKHFPYAGTMLVLAEHYRKRGEFRKARAAVESVLEAAGESPPVLHLYAACLDGEGDPERAAELYRRALALTFGA
jgi:tetratricopeptide (TPR) repeat protein